MNIQSLSVCVPGACWNWCPFCVSRQRKPEYEPYMKPPEIYSYAARMEFARDNGCNTMMFTGQCDPDQDVDFILRILQLNQELPSRFKNIELQTSGRGLDVDTLRALRSNGGHPYVTGICLSLASDNSKRNAEIIGAPFFDLHDLCKTIKDMGFVLRLSLNLSKEFEFLEYRDLIRRCSVLGAHQITFRKLYETGLKQEQAEWVRDNSLEPEYWTGLDEYIQREGSKLEVLPYGRTKYSIRGMGVVLDDDCMAKDAVRDYRYLILRPDGHLYSRWDDPASLIF